MLATLCTCQASGKAREGASRHSLAEGTDASRYGKACLAQSVSLCTFSQSTPSNTL